MDRRPRLAPLPVAHALFSTAFGECGLAWTSRGLVLVQLPEQTPAATLARMLQGIARRSFAVGETATSPPRAAMADEGAPPDWARDAMSRLERHLAGEDEDLSVIPLDMARVPPFFRRVYEEARAVPRGLVRSYAEIAAAAGSPAATRAVGQAMAKNPWPVVVPCHRVVGSAGKPGGFSAPGGLDTKARLLALEGAPLILGGPRWKTRPAAS